MILMKLGYTKIGLVVIDIFLYVPMKREPQGSYPTLFYPILRRS